MPDKAQIRRWRRYLADEIAEEKLYRTLAERADGTYHDIFCGLAEAESRHQAHWVELLGDKAQPLPEPSLGSRVLSWLAKHFGMLFVLMLAQRAEKRSPYDGDVDASRTMAADEEVHAEVISELAQSGREQLAGNFRAAVFGANDGIVSNTALIMGFAGTGVAAATVTWSGVAGLIAGAVSMAAGEYVSVKSQNELLSSSKDSTTREHAIRSLNVDANELALIYRARGFDEHDAMDAANKALKDSTLHLPSYAEAYYTEIGKPLGAASSSFAFFAIGAILPIIPFLFGASGIAAIIWALVISGVALMLTGSIVALLSGKPIIPRALRQLAIGWGAAGVAYVIGASLGGVFLS